MLPESLNGLLPVPKERRPAKGKSQPHVLIIDDDPHVGRLLVDRLGESGYRASMATGATEALSHLRAGRFELIFCDVSIPGANGVSLAQSLSDRHPTTPVVLVAGQPHTSRPRSALPHGAADLISKPFDLDTIAAVVERNIATWAKEKERLLEHDARILLAPIRMCAAAIDAKQSLDSTHSSRVAMLAERIGTAVGLSETDARILRLASFAHDLGKIAVPDSILNKSGPLTEQEWMLVQQHPERSASIVGMVSELAYVADTVRHHHERIDGRGYPDGLRGDSIPLLARVIAVADAYEAMTSNRPYRSRMRHVEAIEELRRHAGTQFDGEIVEALVVSKCDEVLHVSASANGYAVPAG